MTPKNFRYISYNDGDTIHIELKRAGMFLNQHIGFYRTDTCELVLSDTYIVRNRLKALAQHFGITMNNYRYGESLMSFNSWSIALTFKKTVKRDDMQYYRMMGV